MNTEKHQQSLKKLVPTSKTLRKIFRNPLQNPNSAMIITKSKLSRSMRFLRKKSIKRLKNITIFKRRPKYQRKERKRSSGKIKSRRRILSISMLLGRGSQMTRLGKSSLRRLKGRMRPLVATKSLSRRLPKDMKFSTTITAGQRANVSWNRDQSLSF